jgi:5'-deoxynucleotidase YfbR-like HD superfamily hydrolase
MNIHSSPKGCIRTNSGLFINVFDPKRDVIAIEDIAHALASIPRFGGHLNRHYSVAQHSVMCMMRVKSLEDKKAALMHDASEAYLGDIPTPIKAKLPEYKTCEHNLMLMIADKFGFEYPLNEVVKEVDARMLQIEWENLVLDNAKYFKCWNHRKAKETFLKSYRLLFEETVVV